MVRSIAHKGLKRFAMHGDASGLPVQQVKRLRRMLLTLDAAAAPQSMNVPGWNFHELKGRRAGTYAVSVSGNWRLTFRWSDGAIDVNLEDYH